MVKKIKKISKEYLERAAFYYLGKYASGEGNLKHILEKKVNRAAFEGSDISSDAPNWVNDVVAKCVKLGLASDKSYAEMKVISLLSQGKSIQKIKMTLFQKRVAEHIIEGIIALLKEEGADTDLKSAQKYAKKRRFGPFRKPLLQQNELDGPALKKLQDKEIGAMIRAGFSYTITKEVLVCKEQFGI